MEEKESTQKAQKNFFLFFFPRSLFSSNFRLSLCSRRFLRLRNEEKAASQKVLVESKLNDYF